MELIEAYEVLELKPGASEQATRAVYRALTKLHHPDVGGQADEFRRIRDAFRRIEEAGFPASAENEPSSTSASPEMQAMRDEANRQWERQRKEHLAFQARIRQVRTDERRRLDGRA